jgi:hypothetical protein
MVKHCYLLVYRIKIKDNMIMHSGIIRILPKFLKENDTQYINYLTRRAAIFFIKG